MTSRRFRMMAMPRPWRASDNHEATALEAVDAGFSSVLYTDGGSNIVHRSILWKNPAPACATAPAYSTQIAAVSIGSCFIGYQNPHIIGKHPHYELETNQRGQPMWETNTSQSACFFRSAIHPACRDP